jgi:hypothetical protein
LHSGRQPQKEFLRRIKNQTVLPCAEIVPMLLWALLASGLIQSRCRLTTPPENTNLHIPGARRQGISTAFATRPATSLTHVVCLPLTFSVKINTCFQTHGSTSICQPRAGPALTISEFRA